MIPQSLHRPVTAWYWAQLHLHQMVGERYRDLIDAAKSIMELRTGSEQIGQSMGHLMQVCQSLQQTHFLKGLGGMQGPPSRNETHLVAAQMRLLGDTPEKIWHCLKDHRCLAATQLYLLACYTHSQLQLSLTKNSMVQQLWHSTATFKLTILECFRHHLQISEPSTSAMLSSCWRVAHCNTCLHSSHWHRRWPYILSFIQPSKCTAV